MLDSLDNGRDEAGKTVKTSSQDQTENWSESNKKLKSDSWTKRATTTTTTTAKGQSKEEQAEEEEEEEEEEEGTEGKERGEKDKESCRGENMCPRNGGNLNGANLKLGKNCLKMIPDESERQREGDVFVRNVTQRERTKCTDQECCTESPQTLRMTGSSCRALKCAVSTLHRLDDFNMEKIGSGFFSEVFKVTHKVTGNVMVLKMNLLRSNRPNMLKEVQLMNQLKHRNILNFRGVCVHEGQLHALTEYINGGSLEQLIQSRNIELPYLTRQELALDIARGMEYLHGKGVFHRDLTSKNVLIKKSDAGNMMAVVGDFGLAAKIPDPKCKYRLPTVGSAYWMSPECLKGQWYNEKSDIFSYGIVLCEMIARIEADPDVLPRTDNFGLDYLAFSELCGPCPPHFLKLAFSCSTFEPKSRPSFSDIVKTLEKLIPEYVDLLKKESDHEVKMVNAGSLNNLIEAGSGSDGGCGGGGGVCGTNMTARSEEVISNCNSSTKDIIQHRKLHHRRSLSEDVANVVFPRHTAPSDKARCHYLSTPKPVTGSQVLANPKFIGESMCQVDPHYKPRVSGEKGSRSNPFLSLAQFRGAKKIVASQILNTSKDSLAESPTFYLHNDLFSSCFELPSPFYGITPPSSPVVGSGYDGRVGQRSADVAGCCGCCVEGCDEFRCGVRPPTESTPESGPRPNQYSELVNSSSPEGAGSCCRVAGSSCRRRRPGSACDWQGPRRLQFAAATTSRPSSTSLPSSPSFRRKVRTFRDASPDDPASAAMPKKLIKSRTVPLIDGEGEDPGKTDAARVPDPDNESSSSTTSTSSRHLPLKFIFQDGLTPEDGGGGGQTGSKVTAEKRIRSAEADLGSLVNSRISTSSSSLLEATADEAFLTLATSGQLKRRGSCESGFFSCVGEDFGVAGGETISSCEYVLQSARQKHLDNSSATLSSSSAASSLFLLDDSLSTTTVSSLRSGSGDFNDVDDLASRFAHHSILFTGKRPSSSVYTDSSEDVSSLGDVDDRNQSRYQSQQISKIVEYFERKQTGGGVLTPPLSALRNDHGWPGKGLRRNFANVEFQKNIERFDSSNRSSDDGGSGKIKWDGLEGKFKKSGMGLTQKTIGEEERYRSGMCGDCVDPSSRQSGTTTTAKKFGPQNPAESPHPHQHHHHRFDGGTATATGSTATSTISDTIRKSKIELLRKSLERGTLQVPGIRPNLAAAAAGVGGSGTTQAAATTTTTRPLATRLMICEGAVKSKLPLFDKK